MFTQEYENQQMDETLKEAKKKGFNTIMEYQQAREIEILKEINRALTQTMQDLKRQLED